MGEGRLVILISERSLGGRSRDRALAGLKSEPQVRGLPGASSHRKGTEAWVRSGGVSMPVGSYGLGGRV